MTSCRLQIRVIPNAKRSAWVGKWNETYYKIALHAPAVDGKANKALIDFLSETLNLPKKMFSIVSGQTNRCKVIEIQGISQTELPLPKDAI